ncbi:hypothetical protein L1887_52095 [Cichorium endivia]|nr:hypothetical protein L1887_52095 [Cichorium endivia]
MASIGCERYSQHSGCAETAVERQPQRYRLSNVTATFQEQCSVRLLDGRLSQQCTAWKGTGDWVRLGRQSTQLKSSRDQRRIEMGVRFNGLNCGRQCVKGRYYMVNRAGNLWVQVSQWNSTPYPPGTNHLRQVNPRGRKAAATVNLGNIHEIQISPLHKECVKTALQKLDNICQECTGNHQYWTVAGKFQP